ncbi:MAG TPA: acyl-CoA dehydrogenase family protein [Candidatus Dormibacteraeota bacterium]
MSALSPEREELRRRAREFALAEVLPVADELDRQKVDIPWELIEKVAAQGYFGITIPREHGGLGLGLFEYCLVSEELARAWMSVASIIARGNSILFGALADDPRRSHLMAKVARGEYIGAFALSEEQTGSDVAGIATTARREGDEWVLDGDKKWAGWALPADFIMVFARTSPPDAQNRHRGISCFLVEKERDSFPPGMSGEPIDKIGYHGLSSWRLRLDGVRVPAGNLLGVEGEGFRIAVSGLDKARVHTAARAVGAAQAALEDATAYARTRVQFGHPIADFQAIRFKLAEMATDVEAGRQLWRHAAELVDAGGRHDRLCSMAKLFASDMAERVTTEGLQILGGAGYTTEHAMERHWRDARLTRIFEGTSEIQKRIISDRLLEGPAAGPEPVQGGAKGPAAGRGPQQ